MSDNKKGQNLIFKRFLAFVGLAWTTIWCRK
jgi:hypothetical protein